MLPVRLLYRQATTPYFSAPVDSGADVSAFQVGVARNPGIDLASCRTTTAGGVGGSLTAYAYDVVIELEGRSVPAEVRFVPMPIALLGRRDVFMQFLFAVDQRAQTHFVEPY
jgi:hypothetical protein